MMVFVVLKIRLNASGIEFGDSLLYDLCDLLALKGNRTTRESMMEIICGLALFL